MEQIAQLTGKNIKLFSKYIAPIAVAVYVSGFLIFSLHCASYGFFDSDPVKTRILAAGILFLFLSGIPFLLVFKIADHYKFEEGTPLEKSNLKITLIASLKFLIACSLVAQPIANYLFIKEIKTHSEQISWFEPLPILISIFIILGIITLIIRVKEYDEKYNVLSVLIFLGTLVSGLIAAFLSAETSPHMKLTLWFFFIGGLGAYTNNCLKRQVGTGWEEFLLPALLIGIFIYSTTIYPKINFSWGGGSPVPAIIYMDSKNETFLNSNTKIRGRIVDETNEGVFFILAKQSNAIFIPNSSIAGISYSSQPLFVDDAIKEPYGPWNLP